MQFKVIYTVSALVLHPRLISYRCTRVLEPLLYNLLDPSILRNPSAATYNGREITGFTYARRFDQHSVNHLLETLLSLIKFGGQGFGRIARSSQFQRSNHAGFVHRVQAGKSRPFSCSQISGVRSIALHSPIGSTRSDIYGCSFGDFASV